MPPPGPHRTASKFAQLLGDVLIHHAPVTARINAEETRRQVDDWLEGLEGHTATFVGPFLKQVLEHTDPPEAVKALLVETINPTAAFSSTLEQIFLWGIISSIVSAAVQPFLQGVSNDLWAAAAATTGARPVDPGILATAAGRGFTFPQAPTVTVAPGLYTEAAKSGISADDLNLQASLVGLPPALQELFELKRRGIIGDDDVAKGLREGDFRDDWISTVVQLAHAWLTPGDFVRAAVQAQMTYQDARDWAYRTGLDNTTAVPVVTGGTEATPDMFGLAFSIAGRPPGPQELGRMANRGLIPWDGTGADALTFQQGIAESDVKTKWTAALKQLEVYVPPPRQVGSLLEHGAITADQAVKFWTDGGVPEDLAKGYLYMTEQEHIGQDKLLAKGEITTGYFDGIINKTDAVTMLGLLGFRDDVAEQILAIVDFRREIQAINKVISKVGTYYAAFKISPTNAKQALEDVGVSGEQADTLMATWNELRIQPLRIPTTGEISAAVKYGTLTIPEALEKIERLGYEPEDAAIVLSAGAETAVTPLPPGGAAVV